MTQKKRLRCAIYTRKSTEEGLDQAFNSLDVQREACAAYALSQKSEGRAVLPNPSFGGRCTICSPIPPISARSDIRARSMKADMRRSSTRRSGRRYRRSAPPRSGSSASGVMASMAVSCPADVAQGRMFDEVFLRLQMGR